MHKGQFIHHSLFTIVTTTIGLRNIATIEGLRNIATMELPQPAVYKPAKNGGRNLIVDSVHEFSKNKDDGKKTFYVCRQKTSTGCKVTAAVCKDTDQVVKSLWRAQPWHRFNEEDCQG